MRLVFDDSLSTVKNEEILKFIDANKTLIEGVQKGEIGLSSGKGWYDDDSYISDEELDRIQQFADKIRKDNGCLVVVGVGGSNRSGQAMVEGLYRNGGNIFYLGNNLSYEYYLQVMKQLQDRNVYVDVIAKNFSTLEPSIAFRMLREAMRNKYKEGYLDRFVLTGSHGKGQLYELAQKHNVTFLDFPQRIGGRFSAFSAVSLLPMAVAGIDIRLFVNTMRNCKANMFKGNLCDNIALRYAVERRILSQRGFVIENLVSFEPSMEYLLRWWVQLHGETEGKSDDAIFPVMSNFSEDLHAMGQFIQEGSRNVFETFLHLMFTDDCIIASDEVEDGLGYLTKRNYSELNEAVYKACLDAHSHAGAPILQFQMGNPDVETMATFMYTMMVSAYFSAVFAGVEPFDQNGVEMYKKSMYKLLGKE